MRRFVLITLLLFCTDLKGQAVRTFVSTNGSDANPCSRSEPCRTFGAAHVATASAGEIVALDTGGYGPFTVNKSISVIAPAGIHASIAPTSGSAILVSALFTDQIVIRGIYLNGKGAERGIEYVNAGSLFIENCVISNFEEHAIQTAVNSPIGRLFVTDSTLRLNTYGAEIQSTEAGALRAVFDNTRFERNFFFALKVHDDAVVRNCIAASSNDGFWGHTGTLMIQGSAIHFCVTGIISDVESTVWVSNTVITHNYDPTAWNGELISFGNNKVHGNFSPSEFAFGGNFSEQ